MIYATIRFLLSRLTTEELFKLRRDIELLLINQGWLGWRFASKTKKEKKV